MAIIDAVRRHFGSRWKADIRVLGREAYLDKLAELQKEIVQLQASCDRLRMADRREPSRRSVDGSDIRVVSERVEAELATLHGWAVSLVETLFALVGLETDEERVLQQEWKRNL
jgi:hypothetical protein